MQESYVGSSVTLSTDADWQIVCTTPTVSNATAARPAASSIVYADMAFKMLNAACFPSLYYEIHTTEMRREEEAFLVLGWLLSNGVDGEAGEQERQHLKSILRAPNAH